MQDVEAPETLHSLGNRAGYLGPIGNVAMDEMRIAARVAGARTCGSGRGLSELAIDLSDDDPGAFFGEALSRGTADTAAGPRDDGHFSMETRTAHDVASGCRFHLRHEGFRREMLLRARRKLKTRLLDGVVGDLLERHIVAIIVPLEGVVAHSIVAA